MANVAKRSHKDSSDPEKDVKKRRYEEFSEEEEEDEEHDEEEDDAVRNAENTTGPWKWNVEDSHRLLISIMLLLPQCDVEPYSEQEAKIDWEKVAFSSFTADRCREHWRELTKKVRLYRTMSDLVADALSLLPRPSSSFQMIQKNNQKMNLKPNPIKKKSSIPKMVMNTFNFFMQEKLKTLQHIPALERMKHVSQMYKFLSETEKNELNERYDEMKRNHIKVLKKLKEDNPLLAEEVDAEIKRLEKIPGKPRKKYMNKEKTTPAQTVGGSERKRSDQSSDDFGKKSASKPQSAKAAEEEDSSTSDSSDNKEESNPSSVRSPKKSAPVKSASTPHKSKAIVEKPSVPDHSGSEDESDQSSDDFGKKSSSKPQSVKAAEEEDSSTSDSSDNKEVRNPSNGRSPKKSVPVKSASRPQKFKAVVEKPVSDHSGSEDEEEKQRPKPPEKGHSAIPEVVSQKKKSVSLTSLKPASTPDNGLKLSKPSQSKKKKKKKEGVVTGLSQFVTTKMSAYRQIYPELNDREIAMKLAGKWERLSDKKKNKYEKLALKKMPSEEVD